MVRGNSILLFWPLVFVYKTGNTTMDSKVENTANEGAKIAIKKTRHASRPVLSRVLINIMIDFLLQEDTRPVPEDTPVWTEAWGELLKEDTEIKSYARGISVKHRFLKWMKMLDLITGEDEEPRLCIAGSKKLLPSKDEVPRIIRDAHRMVGEFKASDLQERREDNTEEAKSCKKDKHNSVEKVIKLIKSKYVFGGREFGIRKTAVYREILKCPECHEDGKLKIPGKDVIQEAELIDPDFGNEMNYISLKNAPVSFTLKGPSRNSVWYDQAGLAKKRSVYKKLLGVIKEVGIEIGKSTENDALSKERLITKLCCAEKLVSDMKEKAVDVFAYRIPTSHFLSDYAKLKYEYLSNDNISLYLQDMNFLMNTYKSFKNGAFLSSVNATFKELARNDRMSLKIVQVGDGLVLAGHSYLSEKFNNNTCSESSTSTETGPEDAGPPGKIPRMDLES